MKILVIDVGGTHVNVHRPGHKEPVKIPSGPTMTAKRMVGDVKKVAAEGTYSAVSIGYPGPVVHGRPVSEPCSLWGGWIGFDFTRAFGHRVKVVNGRAVGTGDIDLRGSRIEVCASDGEAELTSQYD